MIQTISAKLAKYMFEQGIYEESYEIHKYGIEVMLSTIINIIVIVFMGLLSSRIIDSVLYCLGFWIIRKFSGGYHCKTYFSCMSAYFLTFLIYLYSSFIFENVYVMLLIDTIALLTFVFLSPIKNRECAEEDYQEYKRISLILLLIYIILSWCTIYSAIFTYVIFAVSFYMVVCIPKMYEK